MFLPRTPVALLLAAVCVLAPPRTAQAESEDPSAEEGEEAQGAPGDRPEDGATDSGKPARAEPTQPQPSPEAACFPQCRRGFLCNQGKCLNSCNPPCPESAVCDEGRCLAPQAPPTPVLRDEGSPVGTAEAARYDGAREERTQRDARRAALLGSHFVLTPQVGLAGPVLSNWEAPFVVGAAAGIRHFTEYFYSYDLRLSFLGGPFKRRNNYGSTAVALGESYLLSVEPGFTIYDQRAYGGVSGILGFNWYTAPSAGVTIDSAQYWGYASSSSWPITYRAPSNQPFAGLGINGGFRFNDQLSAGGRFVLATCGLGESTNLIQALLDATLML